MRKILGLKWRYIIPFLVLLSVSSFVLAQSDERVLVPDTPITASLSNVNPAQVYTFAANAGDLASISTEATPGLALTLLLTDSSGDAVAQVADTQAVGAVRLDSVPLPESGVYYVTVFVTAGVETETTGDFTITLTLDSEGDETQPEATEVVEDEVTAEVTQEPLVEETVTPEPQEETFGPEDFNTGQVLTSNGIQVNLSWDSPDDMNLQVRDPVGQTLFWDSRSTTNGGSFGFDVNGLCEVTAPTDNVETASWPAGPVATGSYEVLIYYRQPCEGGGQPVNFIVDVTVDGEQLDAITGTLRPPAPDDFNVFIASFTVNDDASASVGDSGPYTDTRILTTPADELLALPTTPVQFDVPVQGVILNEQPYQTFQFDGENGDIVSIDMSANEGSLDTLFLVLDSAGNVIDANDDIQTAVNTNSALTALRLPTTDTYTVVATRYGKEVGGTEGTFTLVVSGTASVALPQSIVDLQLPDGDIEITLTWTGNADLRLLVRDPQLNSIFNDQTTSPTGGRIIREFSNINCTVAPSTPTAYVYWPPGFLLIGPYEIDIWHRAECEDPLPVQFTLYITVAGDLVFTQTATITFDQHYIVGFEVLNLDGEAVTGPLGLLGGSETINYQDELASAVSISTGVGVPGAIANDNPFDVYTFEGQAGDVITLDMRSNGNLDTALYLLNSAGLEIAGNDDASEDTTDSLISNILLTEDGTYTVLASRFGTIYGGTEGPYTLTLGIN